MNNLFIVINIDHFFLSHRKEIALNAQKAGYEVTIVTKDTGKIKEIEMLGLVVLGRKYGRNCILVGFFTIFIIAKNRRLYIMWD